MSLVWLRILQGIVVLVLVEWAFMPAASAQVACPGNYGGHLQGVATDQEAIYWSFTVQLVKTDMDGKVLKVVDAPSHQGDLTCHDGKLYVAVNRGQFNKEPGKADSWVYVYDSADLSLLSKHEVQEAVHGAGGMAYCKGHFFVIGGLPGNYEENYVYEYDPDFTFIKRHVIKSGQTKLGIQTACYADGQWWFGCYGDPRELLKTDEAFGMLGNYIEDWSIGIVGLANGTFLRGSTAPVKGTKRWTGAVAVAQPGTTKNCLSETKK